MVLDLRFVATAAAFMVAIPGAAVTASQPALQTPTGPAWWRVSDSDSEVWIVGTPDRLPIYTRWNDSDLQVRMRGAKRLIVPANPNQLRYPYPGNMAYDTYPVLANRLDSGLFARVRYSLDLAENRRPGQKNGVYRQAADVSRTLYAARLIADSVTFDWTTGNPVASKAKGYALNSWPDIVVETLDVSASGLRGTVTTARIPEALQVACVEKVVGAMETGELSVATYRAAINAWARGDVAGALKRYDYLDTCSYGALGRVFWSRVVDTNVTALQRALASPGKSVAVVEFDPLLMSGGVIERLRAAGYRVEQVSGGAASRARGGQTLTALNPAASTG